MIAASDGDLGVSIIGMHLFRCALQAPLGAETAEMAICGLLHRCALLIADTYAESHWRFVHPHR